MLPAQRMLGITLKDGWKVIQKIDKDATSTGGNFSQSYIVESPSGIKAFLKALDYSEALNSDDPARDLNALTEAFLFERDVLEKCKNEKLDKVVIAITDGSISIEGSIPVQYLIFELADGDVRKHKKMTGSFDLAWKLRSLHNIAVGLEQLHRHGIAHQDLKPSNVLVFSQHTSKLADFGRSSYTGHLTPYEENIVPGDWGYAPPELLYQYIDPDWKIRRIGCDIYHLGSMVVYFFLGVQMTTLLRGEMPESLWWNKWGGTWEEILPYINDAFSKVLDTVRENVPDLLKNDLVDLVSQLCNPDPRKRGNIKNNNFSSQFSLEYYISHFDLLARKAELRILKE